MELFFDLLWWLAWWFPVHIGSGVVRVATLGRAHAENELLCGIIGGLFLVAVAIGLVFLFK
jgi:hypothetical protein